MKPLLYLAAGFFITSITLAQNLLVNGDFEQGDVGFSSQYLANTSGAETYAILDDSQKKNSLFTSIKDHTTGTGLMMAVNGSTRQDAPFCWSQQVTVQENTDHVFSLWAANLFGSAPGRFLIRINDQQIGEIFQVDPALGEWNQYSAGWNSGSATTARIEIVFTSIAFGGNDTALDDLSFTAGASPCLIEVPNPSAYEELSAQVIVPGNANPFLAGQPDGATTKSDSAPDESPVFATAVTPGDILAFSAEGSVSFGGAANPTSPPDGTNPYSSDSALGIAGYTLPALDQRNGLPIDALVGVFLSDSAPADPAPDSLEYPEGLKFEVLAPGLHQIFFIGDGMNASIDGVRQQFVVPPGATRLFLASTDGFGWYNNTGNFDVTICRLRNLAFTAELGPTTIGFDKESYSVDAGQPVTGSLLVDPLPAGGLYSSGMIITVRDHQSGAVGVVTPTINPILNFDGPLTGQPSFSNQETGSGGIKGSANFLTSRPSLQNQNLASFTLNDLPPGTYDLAIIPWNQLGPTEDIFVTGLCQTLDPFITFGAATLEVMGNLLPELTITGDIALNRQTSLLEQSITVTNNTGSDIAGFRLFVTGLPEGVKLWNAHGEVDGVPYIDIFEALASGQSMNILLEYYRPNRQTDFTPTFNLAPPEGVLPPVGQTTPLNLGLRIMRLDQAGLLVEFLSEAGKTYSFEYSDDMNEWSSSVPEIEGTGERIQWIDSGPPKTNTFPSGTRFYRIIEK